MKLSTSFLNHDIISNSSWAFMLEDHLQRRPIAKRLLHQSFTLYIFCFKEPFNLKALKGEKGSGSWDYDWWFFASIERLKWKSIRKASSSESTSEKNHHIYIPSAGYFAGKRTTFSPISIWCYPLLFKSPHSLTTVCQRSKRPLYIYVLSMLHLCGNDCYMAIAHVKNHYILLILLHTNTKCSQGKRNHFLDVSFTHLTVIWHT